METIAVYFEPKVRTYGINLKTNLLLCELTISLECLGKWGQDLQSLADVSHSFHLVWACPAAPGAIKFFLLCDDEYWDEINSFIKHQQMQKRIENVGIDSAVEMVYFQGPHFGDRHGIADFTLKALLKEKIPYKAMTCSGATVYLVFSRSFGATAKQVLSNAFEIPHDKKR